MLNESASTVPVITLELAWLEHGRGLETPAYQTLSAAGMDLQAAIMEPVALAPMQRRAIPCGFILAIPPGFEAQVRPRSGLALKHGISVPNAPGTIDADYRGELQVLLINFGPEPFVITRGMRIAQLVICPVVQASWQVKASPQELTSTERGSGGFGSTGH